MDEDLHRQLGDLWFAQKNYPGAIREYTAVVAMHPLDKASAQFDLAQAYFAAGQQDKAEDQRARGARGRSRLSGPLKNCCLQTRGLREREMTDGHSC